MKCNSRKIISAFVFTLCAVCIILAASLFYLLVPHLQITKSDSDAQLITNQIISTTSADFAIFWQLNLESNSQRSIAISSKQEENLEPIQAVVNKIEQLKLSAAYGPEELYALLSGKSWCSNKMPTMATFSIDSKNYFQENSNRYVCFIPVVNRSNSLIGKVSVVWQTRPVDQEVQSAIVQIKGITAE